MLSWHAAISQTTTWRTRHGRICAGAWGERPRPGRLTSGPSASHSRTRSGGFSIVGWGGCRSGLAARVLLGVIMVVGDQIAASEENWKLGALRVTGCPPH